MDCKSGEVAFITGGASGIGLGTAKILAAEGMSIALADIEEGALQRAVEEITSAGGTAAPFVVDVKDRQAMAAAKDAVLGQFGKVNLIFNNAGVNAMAPIDELTYDDWDWVMGVNLDGVINGVMAFVHELKKHGTDAHIVSTASVGGLVGMPNLAIYNTTKFGVVGLSEALRADLRESGVGVSVLCPGLVKTNLATSERNRPGNEGKDFEMPGDDPMSAMGMDPQEIGKAVLDAVRGRDFFICTHPEFKDVIKQRNAALEAAFKGEAPQDVVDVMRAMVWTFD